MTYSPTTIWLIIFALGVGTFAIRFSFLGLFGQRTLPDWALRHLRYTAVAILPALVAPMVVFPSGGEVDPWRIAAALATLAVGYVTRNVLLGILAGAGTLWGIPALLSLV